MINEICTYDQKKKRKESEKVLSIYLSRSFHIIINGKMKYTNERLAAKND
jgi:hypothetical protein